MIGIVNRWHTYLGSDMGFPGAFGGVPDDIGSFLIVPMSSRCLGDVDIDSFVKALELD